MRFFYCDEIEGVWNSQNFNAMVLLIVEEEDHMPVREHFFSEIHRISELPDDEIGNLPNLHAADLDRSFSDLQKIEIFRAAFQTVSKFNLKFFRVGDFNESNKIFLSRHSKLDSSILNAYSVADKFLCKPSMFVFEINISDHKKFKLNWSDQNYHYIFNKLGYDAASIKNFENVVGEHYGDKENCFLRLCDFLAYGLRLYDKKEPTEFQKKILREFQLCSDQFIYSAIVWWNDPNKTYETHRLAWDKRA